jgi:hypothetical protein
MARLRKMTELSPGGLALLQQLGAAGLIGAILLAGACAVTLLIAGSEKERRQVAAAREAVELARQEAQRALPDALRWRSEVAAARTELAALREANERSEAEAARLAELAAMLESRLDEAENPVAALPDEVRAILSPESPRQLAAVQAEALKADLQPHAGDFSVEVTSAPDQEARLYAAQLAATFRQAGIPTEGPYGVLTTLEGGGVFVSTEGPAGATPGATVLAALQNASLPAQPVPNDPDAATFLLPEETDVRIYIGAAPGA